MASLRRSPNSPYWMAVITRADGSRTNLSTKTTDKHEAHRIAAEYQDLENNGKQGNLTTDHAKKVLNGLLERYACEPINSETVADYLRGWAKGKSTASTVERYSCTVELFLDFLGKRNRVLIGAITHKDVLGFIESRATSNIASKTISVDVKALNTAFNLARRLGIRADNPVEKALAIKPMIITSSEKECFQPEQISLLLKHATGDWKTMVLLGCYTGARLGDCANMKWANVNFEKHVIDFQPQKTRKNNARVIIPMHPDLETRLMKLASTDTDGFLCPSLAQKGIGGKSGLSEKFKTIMTKAGIDSGTSKGQGIKQFSKLSFHSLRHTFNSALANAGVDQETRMAFTGHSTKAINSDYTHLDLAKLKGAISMLRSFAS